MSFPDKKNFRLDESDGTVRGWVDNRAPLHKQQCRQACGGGLMIWIAFGYFGVSDAVVDKR